MKAKQESNEMSILHYANNSVITTIPQMIEKLKVLNSTLSDKALFYNTVKNSEV
ncbi:ATP-dependent 3'-5' DNA helicase [Fusarium falciforme]|nr:ATP-dependent 3'-5' DNA helicase [Fusarium falciforme]